jgi:transcriptional regulator with XRE-family HTH domain
VSNDALAEVELDTLAERLRAARRRRGWTQAELAERVGVTQAQVSHWETIRVPGRDLLAAVAEALNVSLDHLLLGRPFRELDR